MKKRSVVLNGHGTSVTLEDEFWAALKVIAAAKGESMRLIICSIDDKRTPEDNLSSLIRLFVLRWYQEEHRRLKGFD